MSGAIMDRLWGVLKMNPQDDDKEEDEEIEVNTEDEEEVIDDRKLWGKRGSKIVNMPQAQQVKMVISQPTTFDQAEGICDLLKERKSVIVNLEYVNKDVARRIIDVVSGATHVLDGQMQKITNAIFLIAPYNYDITTDMAREEIKNKLSVSWLRNSANQ